jgi:hypothetical protein
LQPADEQTTDAQKPEKAYRYKYTNKSVARKYVPSQRVTQKSQIVEAVREIKAEHPKVADQRELYNFYIDPAEDPFTVCISL